MVIGSTIWRIKKKHTLPSLNSFILGKVEDGKTHVKIFLTKVLINEHIWNVILLVSILVAENARISVTGVGKDAHARKDGNRKLLHNHI